MPYSDDLRQKVLHAVDSHSLSKAAIARLFGVSLTFLKELVRRRRDTGSAAALPHGGGTRPKLNEAQGKALHAHVLAHPAALLREVAAWLQQECGVVLSLSRLSRLLRRMGLPRKKGRSTPPSATRRPTRHAAPSGGTR
jgi:transposase